MSYILLTVMIAALGSIFIGDAIKHYKHEEYYMCGFSIMLLVMALIHIIK